MTRSSAAASFRRSDRWLGAALLAGAGVSLVVLVGMLLLLGAGAWPVLDAGFERFLDAEWRPSAGRFGLAPLLMGSLLVTVGAMVLAAPLAIGVAVFTRELAPRWLGALVRRALTVFAAIPSVVLGVWGLVAIVPRLAAIAPPGASLLAGCIVLALMIVPTMAVLVDAGLAAVPPEQRASAAALGLSRATTLQAIVLPAALPAIGSAAALGAARAIGETMAVLLVTGNVAQLPSSPLEPVRVTTAALALELPYAGGDHRAALFAAGLVLSLVVGGLLAVAALVRRGGRRG